jgi:hypothetical protein
MIAKTTNNHKMRQKIPITFAISSFSLKNHSFIKPPIATMARVFNQALPLNPDILGNIYVFFLLNKTFVVESVKFSLCLSYIFFNCRSSFATLLSAFINGLLI